MPANRSRLQRVALLSLHSSPIAPLGRSDAGGMNVYVRRLAADLSTRGLAVDVYTRREHGDSPETQTLPGGARLIHLAAGPRRRLPKSVLPMHLPSMVAAFRSFVAREDLEYDLLHTHYWLSGLAGMRYLATETRRTPMIHMFHTLARLKEFYLGAPDQADSALRADGERCLIGRSDVIVGATPDELKEMAALYGKSPARYEVIPPGVDLELFRPLPKTASRRELHVDAERVVLFVGRDDKLKGLDILLGAVSKLPEGLKSGLKVLLVGDSGPRGASVAAQRDRMIGRLGLERIVEVRGKVEQHDLPHYYSSADICAVPSAYESFGMVATEAMACQVPVIAFAVGGLATTIADGQTGLLVPRGDPELFAARLRHALAADNLPSMGRRARMAVQRYTWDRTASRTLGLYEDLVAEYSYPSQHHVAAQ